jgi:hypothetical protein
MRRTKQPEGPDPSTGAALMGHIRLGKLPRTRRWDQVVALLHHGATAPQIARATIRAAETGLHGSADDIGLRESFWLLTQIPLAARSSSFGAGLRAAGMNVGDQPTLMEITSAFSEAIDSRLMHSSGHKTDLGEMAEMAALETLTLIAGNRASSIFATTPDDVRVVFAGLATVSQFGQLSRSFFARLTERSLGYFLSRELANHVGDDRRFATLAQKSEFEEAFRHHCNEAALIVEAFSGEWLSKTNYKNSSISRSDAAGFIHVAIRKMCDELKAGTSR